MKRKDVVFTIISHPDNVKERERLIESIKRYCPADFDYDIIVETGYGNWNEAMYQTVKRIDAEYNLKYGILNFDDDVYLVEGSLDCIREYMALYKTFQFRIFHEKTGRERNPSMQFVRMPRLKAAILALKGERVITPYFQLTGDSVRLNPPFPSLFAGFSYVYLDKSLFPFFLNGFVHDPHVYYDEDMMFDLFLLSKGIRAYTIPNKVVGLSGVTKHRIYDEVSLYGQFNFYYYVFSHPEITAALRREGLLRERIGIVELLRWYVWNSRHVWDEETYLGVLQDFFIREKGWVYLVIGAVVCLIFALVEGV